MPKAAPRPCSHPGCGRAVHGGGYRCPEHPLEPRGFADSRRGSRHDRGYGAEWVKRRERILRRDEGLCQVCLAAGKFTTATEVDHKVNKALARHLGWSDEQIEADENLQAICRPCHKAKTAGESRRG